MLGGKGLTHSSQLALLNANYIAKKLESNFNVRFVNDNGRVAHELLLDLAEFDEIAGIKVMDFAKRLQVSNAFYKLLSLNPYIFRTLEFIRQLVHGQSHQLC